MVQADPGSFREPASGVLLGDNRVYRFFASGHMTDFEALVESGLLDSLVESGAVVETKPLDFEEAPEVYRAVASVGLVVEHPRIPFITYVYERPFEMLRAAARPDAASAVAHPSRCVQRLYAAAFEEALGKHFQITDVTRLPQSERTLYAFCSS